MEELLNDEQLLRLYLLGDLAEAEQLDFEVRLLSDKDLLDQLLVEENELVDDYEAGALSEHERERFESHFLSTPDRKGKLKFAGHLSKYVASEPKIASPVSDMAKPAPKPFVSGRPFYSSSIFRLAAAAVVVAALGIVVWVVFIRDLKLREGEAALREVYKQNSQLQARLPNMDYPPRSIGATRGSAETHESPELEIAKGMLRAVVTNHPSARSYDALGKAYLASHDVDKAIKQFEEALKLDPNNAQIETDLGAAYLELGLAEASTSGQSQDQENKGSKGESITPFAQSLEHLTRALELDNSLREAIYDRALVLQKMLLPLRAEEDWRKYLEIDPSSPWAEEVKRNLRLIQDEESQKPLSREVIHDQFMAAFEARDEGQAWEIFRKNHTLAGNFVTNGLVDEYIRLRSANQQAATAAAMDNLQALGFAGAIELKNTGDHFTTDLATFYRSASAAQLTLAAQARNKSQQAYELSNQSDFGGAIECYTTASDLFSQAGNAGEAILALYRADHCRVLKNDTTSTPSNLTNLQAKADTKQYKWLRIQCFYLLAYVNVALGEYTKAIDFTNASLESSKLIADTNGEARSLGQLAGEIGEQSNKAAFLYLQDALSAVNDYFPDLPQKWTTYTIIGLNLNSSHFDIAAVEYHKEALRIATELNRPLLISRSYQYVGSTLGKLKRYSDALVYVQRAYDAGKDIVYAPARLDIFAHSSLKLANLYAEMGEYREAIAAYDKSLEFYKQIGFVADLYLAHKGKLLAYIALEDNQSAEGEVQSAMDLLESYHSRILHLTDRQTFFNAEQSVIDLAIGFEYSRMHNATQAFTYSERSRARSLLDLTDDGADPVSRVGNNIVKGADLATESLKAPFSYPDIQQRMPLQAQIVQYALLADRILCWIITKDQPLITVELPIEPASFDQLVKRFVSKTSSPSNNVESLDQFEARELYGILVKPIERYLDSAKQICIIPDKVLRNLPFSALVSPDTGKYFVEKYTAISAFSASLFISCSEMARIKNTGRDEKMLSVGVSKFDRIAYPDLLDLDSAIIEARTVASFYPQALPLVGPDAKSHTVAKEMPNYDILELATHYVIDKRDSLKSKLMFALEPNSVSSDRPSNGFLSSYDIYRLRLPKTKLAVLSACSTGFDSSSGGGEPSSLAYPFIAAGVPLIVASLWNVNSDATVEFMDSFHRFRRQDHLSTAESLRREQIEMLHHPNPLMRQPYYWSSFFSIGAYAQY